MFKHPWVVSALESKNGSAVSLSRANTNVFSMYARTQNLIFAVEVKTLPSDVMFFDNIMNTIKVQL